MSGAALISPLPVRCCASLVPLRKPLSLTALRRSRNIPTTACSLFNHNRTLTVHNVSGYNQEETLSQMWRYNSSSNGPFFHFPQQRSPLMSRTRVPVISPLQQGRSSSSPVASGNGAAPNGAPVADEPVEESGYQLPPPEIAEIVDAPPTPALTFSPQRDKLLFMHRPALTPVSELARPELKLAGARIDPELNSRSRMSFYTGLSLCDIAPDGTRGPMQDIAGLLPGSKLNFLSWAQDGKHLAFTVRYDEGEEAASQQRRALELWVADVQQCQARKLLDASQWSLNTVFDSYAWVDNNTLVTLVIPAGRPPPPERPLKPFGPSIQSNETGKVAQARTYPDLLKDRHDEALFEYYGTAQPLLVDLGGRTQVIGEPRLYTSLEPSPDGRFLLVEYIQRPFSYLVNCGRFPKVVEVWHADWDCAGQVARHVCQLPLAEDIPIVFNSTRQGRRAINWRADRPAHLYWAETQDGGDPRVEVSPRDIVYTAPAEDSGEAPAVVARLDLRYSGVQWGDDDLALVYENWYKTRWTRTWAIAPGRPEAAGRVVFERSYEDVYSDPGSFMSRRTVLGTYVIARFVGSGSSQPRYVLEGSGATPEGNRPFLDVFDLDTGAKDRIWQAQKDTWYETVVALMSDGDVQPLGRPEELGQLAPLSLDHLRLLVSRESVVEPPQYFLKTWPQQTLTQISDFPHPYPQLKDLQKEIIRYKRGDGVDLMATLYLPPGYDAARDGPLPLLMWAYPREFKSKDAAGQMRGSPNQFAGIGATSPLLWLARRYAVLDGPTMPIIGEGDQEANDTYVEQLTASAQAAVEEVVRRGVADPARIAVGGHSYGAFMAANLLAHAPQLFACAIARSGAYNRTLTPFGFQAEERTIWEAPDVYMKMSPFMTANKITKPLLLIHGEDDNNTGTFPMQSERFFNALKGHGAHTRLVLLPHESHGYRGRESIMHTLYEMDRWLELHCKAPPEGPVQDEQEGPNDQPQGVSSMAGLAPEDLDVTEKGLGKLKVWMSTILKSSL